MGLSQLGDGFLWGEAKTLIEAYAADPSTHFGAALAGWSYPATTPELITLIATIGDKKVAPKLMPWALKLASDNQATPDEIAEANAELEAGIVFSG